MSIKERQAIVDKHTEQIKKDIVWKDGKDLPSNLSTETGKKITIHQLDLLIHTLNQLGGISDHWNLNASREQLKMMTYKQYRYLNYLRDEKAVIKINQVLTSLKVIKK